MAVSTRLVAGARQPWDDRRAAETRSPLNQARRFVRHAGGTLPVVYAGDVNSDVNRNHLVDGPGMVMRRAAIADAHDAAQLLVHGRYDSANRNLRRPPAVGQSIDSVLAPPGVGVLSREIVLHLSHGRFVGVLPSDHNPVLAALTVPY